MHAAIPMASRRPAPGPGRATRLVPRPALGLLSVAVVVAEEPVGAQQTGSTGVGIRLNDLTEYPTHLSIDGFDVELTNLTSVVAYEVVVSSDSANVGIGGCGTTSQTETVTGVAATELRLLVYACAVGEATVTAEVRRAGASRPEASVSEQLKVEALPEIVIGPTGERIRTTTTPGVSGQGTSESAAQGRSATTAQAPKVGTPGIVQNIRFHDITSKSVHVTWDPPSDGGPNLTGYGLLFWPGTEADQPGWETAEKRGTWPRNRDYTGLQSGKTYNFRIHACNGENLCGYWTHPPKTVDIPTPENPGKVTNLQHTRNGGSVTLTWTAPGKSGSGKLTGYHVQHKESGGSWPVGAAVVTPGTNTRWTGNLSSGTAHDVRVQACNGDSLCSDWVERAIPRGTQEPIVDPTPGPVRDLKITGVGAGTLTVDWDVPSDPGSAALTGYRVQHKLHSSTSWPSTSRDVTSAATTQVTIPKSTDPRLIDGTKYDVQVQAYNGDGKSGKWEGPVCGVPGTTTKPGQVTIRDVTSGPRTLTVAWKAPACVSALTHYEVQATEAPTDQTQDPTWPSTGVNPGKVTETDLDMLTTGTLYLVRVRACNTARTTADKCGAWSDTRTGTPNIKRLTSPENLDVKPLPRRWASLTWSRVSNADEYDVEVQVFGEADWLDPDCIIVGDTEKIKRVTQPYVTQPTNPLQLPACRIDIDSITTDGGAKGLAKYKAYRFRVRAKASGFATSLYSEEIIIVDTPITSANGHSPDPGPAAGKAAITWTDLATLHTDALFSGGTYKLRYRRTRYVYSDADWNPGLFDGGTDRTVRGEVTASSLTSHTFTRLTRQKIYAIQLLYEKDGQKVFTVRDSYVWPSDESFGKEGIATFPIYDFPLTNLSDDLSSMEFEYYICADTFPSADPKKDWVPMINHAMLQWQYATDELVMMLYQGASCVDYAHYTPFLNELIFEVRKLVNTGRTGGFTEAQIRAAVKSLGRNIVDRFNDTGLDGRFGVEGTTLKDQEVSDAKISEIMMIQDSGWSKEDHVVFAFLRWGSDIGLGGCEGGCAHSAEVGSISSTDIYLRESYHVTTGDGILSAVLQSGAPEEIYFNTCPGFPKNYHRPYSSIVHEAGHALGLGHPNEKAVKAAIMSYFKPHPPRCAPHPLDVMAVYALYQSKVSR